MIPTPEKTISLCFLSFFLSGTGAWFISRYGNYLALLDKPNERSSHHVTTPKGGGIGILGGFIAASISLGASAAFWIPAAFLSIISFIGDRFSISPLLRLLIQFSASIVFLIDSLPNHPWFSLSITQILIVSVYMVATTNYYNFMDGINGISGLTGIVGFGLFAYYSNYLNICPNLTVMNLAMALCCLGFLPFNVPKARVFMGDVGSILLGFIFAALIVRQSRSLLEFFILASFLFPFYADEITTALIRLKNGEKIWKPHRKHLYQLLANEFDIPHWKISLGYGMGQAFVGFSILFFSQSGALVVFSLILLYSIIFALISGVIRYRLIGIFEDDI